MNKKKIMLVNISVPYEFAGAPADVSLEQIGLGYLAAVLKEKGHNVCLYDAYSREDSESEIVKKIENYEPDFLCLSPTCFSWDRTIRISKEAKRSKRSIKTVFGGPHVSFEPVLTRALREFDCIDYLVRGEGEISIVTIIDNLSFDEMIKIPGVCCRDPQGQIHVSSELSKQVEDLDKLPFPLRDSEPLSGMSVRITTSRGCYSNGRGCSFCQMPLQNPHGWRPRSPKNVVDEIEYWANKGHDSFVCAEGDFLGLSKYGIKRAGEIGEEILRRNLDIRLRVFGGIPGIIAAEKNGVLSILKKAGLERMYPGIEAGNEEDLKLYEKNIIIDQIKTAIDILRRRSIGLQIGFIMFNPWSNSKRLIANVSLLKQIDQAHLWFNFAYRLGLFPGTRLLDKVCEKGLLIGSIEKVGLGSELVHNYRFKVPYIAQIVNACAEILRAEVVIRVDRLLITAGVLTSNFALDENSPTVDSRNLRMKRKYEEIRGLLANLNTITFFSILELCERGGLDKELENIIRRHLTNVEENVPDVEKLCNNVTAI